MSKKKAEKKIGVYVCHCGGNISNYVDIDKIIEAVKDYPGVAVAKDFMFMCSDTGQQMIIDDIKEYGLDGIVVAACSPKLHEMTFRNTVRRGGLNEYLFYHVNIREHCSWAHTHDRELATKKAISHIITGIEYVKLASSLEKISVVAKKSVLIIGGGIAGIKAAIDLESLGFNVIIVEKTPFLGGYVPRWWTTFPNGESGREVVQKIIDELRRRKNIIIITNGEVEKVEGYIGDFEVSVRVRPRYVLRNHPRMKDAIEACPVEVPNEFDFGLTKRKAIYYPYEGAYPEIPAIDDKACTKCGKCIEILGDAVNLEQKEETYRFKVGAIIVATGFKPYEPKNGEFGYGEIPEVVTLPQLERILDSIPKDAQELVVNGRKISNICFIYCVGSRQEPKKEEKANQYCSRYCCTSTIYTSLKIAERFPGVNIYHLYRDIRTYGSHELYYLEAQRKKMKFIKYPDNEPPQVMKKNDRLIVKVKDFILQGKEITLTPDLVVLSVGMEPNDATKIQEILKVSAGPDGFLQEAHPKLRPVDTLRAGIFIAGAIQGPKTISETLASASAAAAKVTSILIHGKVELEPNTAFVDPNLCDLSKKCMEICPSGAISIKKYPKLGERAWVNEVLCLGCGACTAVCPSEAIQLKTLTTHQIKNMIKASAMVWR